MGANYKSMHNEELIDLLFKEEDRLSHDAAGEIVRRGLEIMPILGEIAMERNMWMADLPEYWATVHAAYLIGAMGGKESVVPLMAALRWSDAYDNEWVTEDLPSIFGNLGDVSWPTIVAAVKDRASGWSARSVLMDALGSQALRFPAREEEAVAILGGILKNRSEEYGARRSASFVLLDFRRADFRRELVSFAREEKQRQQQYPDYRVAFTAEEVEQELASPRINLEIYTHDWMKFYDPEEIIRRQQRWQEENHKARAEFSQPHGREARQSFVIGREDICPCGSGKSYKRCCLRKLH